MIIYPELEERYIVVKIKDLSPAQRMEIEDYLWDQEIETVDGLVIEADWPEYRPVRTMLLGRINGV